MPELSNRTGWMTMTLSSFMFLVEFKFEKRAPFVSPSVQFSRNSAFSIWRESFENSSSCALAQSETMIFFGNFSINLILDEIVLSKVFRISVICNFSHRILVYKVLTLKTISTCILRRMEKRSLKLTLVENLNVFALWREFHRETSMRPDTFL